MKDLRYYLELPYTVIMRRDEDGDYVARIDELPGCAAHGETPGQAFEALEEAKELWITDCLESDDPVPEPSTEDALPSGKWVQRVPRTLHKKLVSLAKRENVSLNQLVASMLAEAVGVRKIELSSSCHAQYVDTFKNIQFFGTAVTGSMWGTLIGEGITGLTWCNAKPLARAIKGDLTKIRPQHAEVAPHG